MSRLSARILLTVVIVGVLGGAATFGVSGLFSATTQNSGDEVSAGTVTISNNSAGQALFNVTVADPGASWTRCVKVTYTGSLAADVRVYIGGTPGPLASSLNLKVEEGTTADSVAFPACTTFAATDTLYDGAVNLDHHDYATGIATYPAGVAGAWSTGSSTVYRVTLTLAQSAPNSGQAQSSGILTAYWEAHNQ